MGAFIFCSALTNSPDLNGIVFAGELARLNTLVNNCNSNLTYSDLTAALCVNLSLLQFAYTALNISGDNFCPNDISTTTIMPSTTPPPITTSCLNILGLLYVVGDLLSAELKLQAIKCCADTLCDTAALIVKICHNIKLLDPLLVVNVNINGMCPNNPSSTTILPATTSPPTTGPPTTNTPLTTPPQSTEPCLNMCNLLNNVGSLLTGLSPELEPNTNETIQCCNNATCDPTGLTVELCSHAPQEYWLISTTFKLVCPNNTLPPITNPCTCTCDHHTGTTKPPTTPPPATMPCAGFCNVVKPIARVAIAEYSFLATDINAAIQCCDNKSCDTTGPLAALCAQFLSRRDLKTPLVDIMKIYCPTNPPTTTTLPPTTPHPTTKPCARHTTKPTTTMPLTTKPCITKHHTTKHHTTEDCEKHDHTTNPHTTKRWNLIHRG